LTVEKYFWLAKLVGEMDRKILPGPGNTAHCIQYEGKGNTGGEFYCHLWENRGGKKDGPYQKFITLTLTVATVKRKINY
jgi:hypothetical protein